MPKIEKDWVDQYFDNGVDIFNRRLFLGDITEESVDKVIKGLFLMEGESVEKPVDLFINSGGGDLYECMALYDTMGVIDCPVHTYGYGKIMSAAPLLLAAGEPDHRWISASASLMFHTWSGEVSGTKHQIKADYEQSEWQDAQWLERFVQHTDKPLAFWRNLARRNRDVYFDADDSMEWGIVDHVWRAV